MLWSLWIAAVFHAAQCIEYPWTFDNDLFGGYGDRSVSKLMSVYSLCSCTSNCKAEVSAVADFEQACAEQLMLPWLMTACIYPCVVGPDFWGLVNRDWRMCTAGQMQSPVNIDPAQLLFDPHLGRISIDDVLVEGTFENIGQLPLITINETLSRTSINITGGPALPYRYKLHQISVHFGHPDGERGSEHTVDRVRFPAEVQLLAYNADLYTNYSQAVTQPRGLLAIAVIVDIGITTEVALRRLTVASQSITYKGMKTNLRQLHPAGLIPRTNHYVTYEGSLTIPGCQETVTWVIMNNPIYITREDLQIWNELQKTESKQADPSYMTPAYRPLKSLNGRLLRTNININYRQSSSPTCSSNIFTEMGYRSNPARARLNQSLTKRDMPRQYLEPEVFEIENIEPESIVNFEQ